MEKQALEYQVGELLRARGLQLGLAESCTGGLVSHRITNVPGSSDFYLGGIVAYANAIKTGLLGVSQDTLNQYGAVSRETVLEMAHGVRQRLSADIGVSISGIAGPGGGTPSKPVGLAWIGVCAVDTAQAWMNIWSGDRQSVKSQAAEAALQYVFNYLNKLSRGLESIEVSVQIGPQNEIRPVKFCWCGKTCSIISTGRRWSDALGQHILVMVPGEHTYELVYTSNGNVWHLRKIGSSRLKA